MIDYTWVAWFEELTTKIAENDESDLADKAKAVDWGRDKGDVALLNYGDENIDPMSFLYFLAQKNTSLQYKRIFGSVHEVFDISSELQKDQPIIPTPVPNAQALFHDGKSFDPDLLWRLFRDAAPIRARPIIQADDFDGALKLRQVGPNKLTETLFLVNPRHFLPVYIGSALPQWERHGKVTDYEGYVAMMDSIKRQFPGCEPHEIHRFLYIQKTETLITEKSDFFQIGTYAYNTEEDDYWERTDALPEEARTFKENNCVYTSGPGVLTKFPLTEPKRGDIILVRTGMKKGRAIGVVEENGYAPDGWSREAAIYVHWINKNTASVTGSLPRISLSNAGEGTLSAFRSTEAYKDTFELIDRWRDNSGVAPRPDAKAPSEDFDPQAEGSGVPFPLNTILFGPPGTGKTWEAVSHAVAIMDGKAPEELAQTEARERVKARFAELREEERVEFVTFHQNYAYEDFIEGIGPVLDQDDLRYEIRHGVFKRIASRAREHPGKRHVLIIDEINRGNIAKIFGELITLIEPSKRSGGEDEAEVTLPYSQEPFSVPGNLYLVGTMNTADRGIALLDTALRRRFDFVEKMPDVRHVEADIENVDGRAMLKAMNERITVCLDREHQIGHTYLIGVKTIDRLAEVFQRSIVPLLQEYFYDDWAKIRSVLNENPFIREHKVGTSVRDVDPERPVFELLPQDDDKWTDAESYRKIYASEQVEAST